MNTCVCILFLCRLLAQLFARVASVKAEKSGTMSNLNSVMEIEGLQDVEPPFGVHIKGIYKKSFAYTTIKDRLPVILTGIVDTMSREKEIIVQKYGEGSADKLKKVIGDLSKLRNEVMTNKPLIPLELSNTDADGDAAVWNNYLKERKEVEGPALSWFNTVWLLSECYMYRRITQALVLSETLRTYDPFQTQKKNGYESSLHTMKILAKHTMNLLGRTDNVSTAERKHEFIKMMKLNLWGNRSDLSLSGAAEINTVGNPVELLDRFESDLLIDDTKVVWDLLNKPSLENETKMVDIVLDNVGYEFFTDLCLASFMIAHNLAEKVRFHVKRIPWFVSDVTAPDFDWIIETMKHSDDPDVKALGEYSAQCLKDGKFTVEVESFWTEPFDFGQMKERSPALYGKLSESVLIIFKGDLNFRKLISDINWEYTTTMENVLSVTGFRPTNLVALRTIKCDLCIGLTSEQVKELSKDKNVMYTGKYGVIHATGSKPCICNNNQ